jgi:hypothetical protein
MPHHVHTLPCLDPLTCVCVYPTLDGEAACFSEQTQDAIGLPRQLSRAKQTRRQHMMSPMGNFFLFICNKTGFPLECPSRPDVASTSPADPPTVLHVPCPPGLTVLLTASTPTTNGGSDSCCRCLTVSGALWLSVPRARLGSQCCVASVLPNAVLPAC